MKAIETLSDIETGVCDDAHIYELSEWYCTYIKKSRWA